MPYSIRFPEDINRRLDAIAAATKRTKASFIKEAVLESIEDWEDYVDAVEALNEPGKRITLEELEKELGLDD